MSNSKVSSIKGKGKTVPPTQNHLIGLEFEKTLPLFPMMAEVELVFPQAFTEIHLIVEMAQIVSLAVLPYHTWGFALNGILRALHFSHIPLYDSNILGLGFIGTLIVCIAAVVLCLYCLAVTVAHVVRNNDDVTNAFFGVNSIRAVRLISYLLSSILFLPLVQNFLSIAYCQPHASTSLMWYTNVTCYTGLGGLGLGICIVGITLLFGMAYLMNTLAFDSNPMSRHYFARAHSLLDVPLMLFKLTSAALMHYFLSTDNMVYHAVWVAVSSLCMAVAFIFVPPHYRKITNQIRSTGLLLCCAMAIFAACSHAPQVRTDFLSNNHSDVAIFLATLPVLAYVFWHYVALARTSGVFVHAMENLHEGHIEQQITHFPRGLPDEEMVFDNNTELFSELMEGAGTLENEEGTPEEYHFTFPYVDYVTHEYDVELATRFIIFFRKFTLLEPTKYQMAYGATIFMKGIQIFRQSSFIRLAFANYLLNHAGKPRLALQQITVLRGMEASFSERYQGFKVLTRLSSILHLGQSTRLEALSRAKRRHREALHSTMEFWQLLLTNDDVDKNALSNATRSILSGKEDVLRIYRILLTKNPNNLDILACYTTFCETLLNDNDATQQCLQCLREGRELKTANTMRGARVKGDTGTMTQIPLDFDENEDDTKQAESIRKIGWYLFMVTLALAIILGGFLAMYFVVQQECSREIKAVSDAGKLRGLAGQCASTAYQLTANLANGLSINDTTYELLGLQQDFVALHNQLTFGVYKPQTTEQASYYRGTSASLLGTNMSVNLWTLGSLVSVALRDIATHPADSPYLEWVMHDLPEDVSVSLNHSVALWETAYASNQQTLQTWTGILLGFALTIVIGGCLIVFYNIHKIEGIRADIFGLFTLIPRKVLRRLFRETRKKYAELDVFFNLSTRKKLVKLIGADQNDQEKLQLHLDEKPDAPDSHSLTHSESEATSSRRGSGSDSIASSVAVGDADHSPDRHRKHRRSKKTADSDEATKTKQSSKEKSGSRVDNSLSNDSAYSTVTWYVMGLLLLGGIVCIVLLAYSSTLPEKYNTIFRKQVRLFQAVESINDDLRESVYAARGYVYSGHQRYFEQFVVSQSELRWREVVTELLAARPSSGYFQRIFGLEDILRAIQQHLAIAVRCSVATFPDNAVLQQVGFSSTFLSTLTWPHEEQLLLTSVSPYWGYADMRTNLIDGSAVDLTKSASAQRDISKAILSSEHMLNLQRHFMEELRAIISVDTLEKDRTQMEHNMYGLTLTATVVSFVCLVLSLGLLYARSNSYTMHSTMNTIFVVGTLLATAACFALALAAFVSGAKDITTEPFPTFLESARSTRTSWIQALDQELDYPRLFLSSGNELWNIKYRDVYLSDFSPSVVNPIADFSNLVSLDSSQLLAVDAANMDQLRSMIDHVSRIKQLDTIAMVMIYTATSASSAINAMASSVVNATYLSEITWNITSESDYYVTAAKYGSADQNLFYNSRQSDLTLSSASLNALATATLYSHRLDDLVTATNNHISNIFGALTNAALNAQESHGNDTASLLVASFSLGVAAFSLMLLMSVSTFLSYSRSDASKWKDGAGGGHTSSGSAAASASSNTASSSTGNETHLPFWFYGLIAMVIIAAGLVVVAEVAIESGVAERLNDATERSWTGSKAFLIGQRMLNDPSYFVEGQAEARVLYRRMLEDVSEFYFRHKSEYFTVGLDSAFDDETFDRFWWYSLLTFFGSNLNSAAQSSTSALSEETLTTATSTATTTTTTIINDKNPYTCNVTKGSQYLLSIARGVGLVYDGQWSSLLQRMTYATPAEMQEIVNEMSILYRPMLLSLSISIDELAQFEDKRSNLWQSVVLGLTIAAIVLTVLMYIVVLTRFVGFLGEEESSARLMLRIIPQDAREGNKQIASYLESGRVKQASDDLNSAITSMSTLPVIAIDHKGIIMRFTQAAETVFGFTSSEVVGLNVQILMPEEYGRNHDTYLANYRRTHVKHVIDTNRRVKGRRKNGDIFPLELRVMELKFGEEVVYIGFAKDISGEIDLAVQDQLNKYVLDMSRDPIITIDAFGSIMNVNQAVTNVFGYAKDELMRENLKMLMPSEIALNHDGYLARYRETGMKHIIDSTRQVQGQRKNGEIFQASVTVREIRQHGEPPLFIGFVVDVTEAHEAAMLNEVNDIISDLSPVPIIAINDKGVFVKFSRAASQLFQYTKEELVGRGQNIQILVPPKFGDHNRFMKAYFTTGVAKVVGTTRNIIARKRDKTVFPAMLTLREIRKESMQPVFLGYIVDITQTLQLEEAGRLANEIMKFSMIPIVVTSTQGIITAFNDAAENTFGYTSDEVVGQNVKMLIPANVAAVHDNIISNYIKTREKNVVGLNRVVQAVRKNGEAFPVDLSLREVQETEHGAGCFFAYMRDVTSHRETLQQFMINDSITQLSTIPILAISNKGLVESFSPAAEECFGYSASEVIGENIKMLMPPEIADKHDEYLRRYRKTGIKTIIDSTRVVTAKKRDGSLFEMEVSVREIKKEGTQSSFVGYCRDTSRDQQLEEQKDLGQTIRDLSTIPIILITQAGIMTYVNDAFVSEFNYERNEVIGMDVNMMLPPEVAPYHSEFLRQYVARGHDAAKSSTVVGRVRRLTAVRKNGTYVEVEAKIAEIRSERSGTLQFVGFIRNLGTQLQLEQANYTIDTITNLSLVPIVAIDHRGLVIKFSNAAETSFGYKASEVLGNNVKMLMPEEVSEKHDGYLRTYFKTHVRTVVGSVMRQEGRKKDGSRFPIELSVREIVKQGQNSLFIGYCRDASQDTALERAMQLSNLVTQLSPIPIVVISRMGIIQTFNAAAAETFEYTTEEALGQDINMLMTPTDAQYHNKYLKTYAKTKIKSAIDAIRKRNAKRKSGDVFSVEVSVKEIIPSSNDEKQICYLGFIRDLSAVQELQQAGLVNDTIASISAVPLIVINFSGVITRFSSSAEHVFGFDSNDVVGRNVKMLMPAATAEKHDGYLSAYKKRAHATGNQPSDLTIDRMVRGKRRSGEEFPAQLSIREVRKQGQEPMFVGYLSDMTHRHEIARKKLITESSIELCSSPIISITPQGIVKAFNEAAEDCFGYTKGEIVGSNIKVLMPRKTAEYHDQFLSTYLKTGVKHVVDRNRDVTAKRKNGKRFAAIISVREVKENNEHFFIGYVRDRSGVAALEQASLVNDAIINMSAVAIIGITETGIITRFSPAAEALFQYKTVEVIGNNVSMLMPEPHRANHDNYLDTYHRTHVKKVVGKTTKNLKAVRKDSTEFNCELSVSEIDIEGSEKGFVAIIVDISERVKSQADFAVSKASEEMTTRALIAIDGFGKVLRANAAACALFGYEPREVVKQNIKMLMPDAIAAQHDKFLETYRASGIKHIIDSSRKVTGRSKQGRLFELEVHVSEVKQADGSYLFLGYLDDISMKKELSIAPSLAETVLAIVPAPLVIINSKGIVTHFNTAAETTFEFEASQVIGRNVNLLMPSDVSKRHDEFLKRYLQTGEKHLIDSVRDVEGETKTGRRVSLRISVREVKKQGNEVMFIGLLAPRTR